MRQILFSSVFFLGAVLAAACGGDPDPSGESGSSGAGSSSGAVGSSGTSGGSSGTNGGSSGGGSSSSGSTSDDAGVGEPIEAPSDQWTWIDFPESKCGDGSATGLGINPHAGATKTLLFMQGGGSCTSGQTCWGPSPGAIYMKGFGREEWESTPTQSSGLRYPILRRDVANNPFKDMNLVFIPYCTGDLHAGATVTDLTVGGQTIPTYFWGAIDMDIFLRRLVPTFPGTERVWIAGVSAGGFGSFLNFEPVVKAFGNIRVDVLDDSGPPIPRNGAGGDGGGINVWGYRKPAECSTCASIPEVYDYNRTLQPNSRYGLLTYQVDTTIAPGFGYTPQEFPAAIDAFTTKIGGDANAHTFVVRNTYVEGEKAHVVQGKPELTAHYMPWIAKMVSEDASWANQDHTP